MCTEWPLVIGHSDLWSLICSWRRQLKSNLLWGIKPHGILRKSSRNMRNSPLGKLSASLFGLKPQYVVYGCWMLCYIQKLSVGKRIVSWKGVWAMSDLGCLKPVAVGRGYGRGCTAKWVIIKGWKNCFRILSCGFASCKVSVFCDSQDINATVGFRAQLHYIWEWIICRGFCGYCFKWGFEHLLISTSFFPCQICSPRRRGKAERWVVLIPSVMKPHCLGGSASLHSSYCIKWIWIYPHLNKTAKFLKLPGAFLQEKGKWGRMCIENLWFLGEIY